jgi:hypothetical protein
VKSRALTFANATLTVEWADESAESLVRFLFAALPEGDPVQAHFTFHLATLENGTTLSLSSSPPGDARQAAFGPMGIYLMDRLCYHLADRSQGGMLFHAACVSREGKAWMLPAPSGSGKSTLAVWLALQGYGYHTDELAFIPAGSLECQALTRPVHLKKTVVPMISALYPDLFANGCLPAGGGWLVPPTTLVPPVALGEQAALLPPAPAAALDLQGIVFPRFTRGAAFEFSRLSEASAALALAGLLINARNLPENGFPEVVRLARSLPAYQLIYSDFEQLKDGRSIFV